MHRYRPILNCGCFFYIAQNSPPSAIPPSTIKNSPPSTILVICISICVLNCVQFFLQLFPLPYHRFPLAPQSLSGPHSAASPPVKNWTQKHFFGVLKVKNWTFYTQIIFYIFFYIKIILYMYVNIFLYAFLLYLKNNKNKHTFFICLWLNQF